MVPASFLKKLLQFVTFEYAIAVFASFSCDYVSQSMKKPFGINKKKIVELASGIIAINNNS